MPDPTDQQLLAAALHLADHGGPEPGWHHNAACHGQPVNHFFPTRSNDHTSRHLCTGCPARTPCLADGIQAHRAGLHSGIRAGLSDNTIRRAAGQRTDRRTPTDAITRALQLTAAGHTAPAIAQLLGVSERTVQRWRTRTDNTGKAA